ncbi:MAG: ABC-F family ATP-binding cassette domain-containing protein [Candidatus Wallbacteria bacterium]|nr:ABC-F family ATP-binding cassette domain-containing protein [Candidatus Wallbacteria bacterium]
MLLQSSKISYRYDEKWLFQDLNFTIHENSRVGIIGKNGSGKSTLFRLILRELDPESGEISRKKGLRIGYLPQELESAGGETILDYLRAFPDYDPLFPEKITIAASRFGFTDLEKRLDSFSGGEKTRVALCRLLLTDPDLLLLDEPTNHLDLKNLEWLENYLLHCRIPYLVISHDRRFLDLCSEEIWEIDGRVQMRSGNYTIFTTEKKLETEQKMELHIQQQKKIRQLKSDLLEKKKWAESFQRETSRNGSHSYRSITNDARRAMKRAVNIQSRISRIIEKEEARKPVLDKERKIRFDGAVLENAIVLRVDNLGKKYGENQVLNDFSLEVENGMRLGLVGRNGCGKSTLLRILAGHDAQHEGSVIWVPCARIGYYAQDISILDPQNNILDEVSGHDARREEFSRTILGCLNLRRDKVLQKISTLSRGEMMKTMLARIICSGANVLLLDEPTNHLELMAREELEDALTMFRGTLIFATHDRCFLEKISTKIIDLEKRWDQVN